MKGIEFRSQAILTRDTKPMRRVVTPASTIPTNAIAKDVISSESGDQFEGSSSLAMAITRYAARVTSATQLQTNDDDVGVTAMTFGGASDPAA